MLHRTGGPSVLEYADVPTPRPAAGEVLVKADTIGVSVPECWCAKAPTRGCRHRRRSPR
jgi:NADPH:quinone reductase-like Zn-dependent oxidoreductase